MLVNLLLTALGAWGVCYTWTKRHTSGGGLFFDLTSSTRNPVAYALAIGVRLLVLGPRLSGGGYRLVVGITTRLIGKRDAFVLPRIDCRHPRNATSGQAVATLRQGPRLGYESNSGKPHRLRTMSPRPAHLAPRTQLLTA